MPGFWKACFVLSIAVIGFSFGYCTKSDAPPNSETPSARMASAKTRHAPCGVDDRNVRVAQMNLEMLLGRYWQCLEEKMDRTNQYLKDAEP